MKKHLILGICGFLFLDFYFNLFALQFSNSYLQLVFILLFFPIAHFVAKMVGINGLPGLGVYFHKGWGLNFLYSFLIGFSFWTIWNFYYFLVGEYRFIGLNQHFFGMPILEVIVGYFLGSFINDIIVRGYIINLLKDRVKMSWIFAISIIIYTLDDFWYEGFSFNNVIFSITLGLSLTYAFVKTGSIWATTGIHFGLNFVYGLFFGQMGKENSSLLIVEKLGTNKTILSSLVDYSIPVLMFLFLLYALNFYKHTQKNLASNSSSTQIHS